jgi:hypothetical protein
MSGFVGFLGTRLGGVSSGSDGEIFEIKIKKNPRPTTPPRSLRARDRILFRSCPRLPFA